jgi:hypothetical protein
MDGNPLSRAMVESFPHHIVTLNITNGSASALTHASNIFQPSFTGPEGEVR